jgi:hypothetical protein
MKPGRIHTALLTVATLSGAWASGSAEGQRSDLLKAARELPSGAAIVQTPRGSVLLATATVPVPAEQREDKAFALAAAAALIEARAEAALFLGGVYATSSEAGSTSTSSGDGAATRANWVRTHSSSLARVKLAGGEPLEIERTEGGVRARVAWGIAEAEDKPISCGEVALGALAEAAVAANEVPACDLRWVRTADGKEGLRVVLAIHPDTLPTACTRGTEGALPCNCRLCRERTLEVLLQRTIGAWAKEGDVGVARTLTRIATRTTTRAKDGAEAVRKATQKSLGASTVNELAVMIPPDFFTKSTIAYRHGDKRSACAAFVPIEAAKATSVPTKDASPGVLRGSDDASEEENDLKPGPGGSFPWPPAPAPATLYDVGQPLPAPGAAYPWPPEQAPATMYDAGIPLPPPGGAFTASAPAKSP